MKSGLDRKRGVQPVFEAKPAPAPHGIGTNPVSGFGGNKTGIRCWLMTEFRAR